MDEKSKMESQTHSSSAAAFVEGGIQDACEDSCSICLEDFCASDPSTVTSCKHEFHLHCILEWCQRSSQCPMCWQSLSLKDPSSQELLEAVVEERDARINLTSATAVFSRPTFGNIEVPNFVVGSDDTELEERLIQHLAAAAMLRTQRNAIRDARGRLGVHDRPRILVISPQEGNSGISVSENPEVGPETEPTSAVISARSRGPRAANVEGTTVETVQINTRRGSQVDNQSLQHNSQRNHHAGSNDRHIVGNTTPVLQDRAGPSDMQSFSESLKTRLNAVSARYRESINKSSRSWSSWRERWFSQNNAVSDLDAEERREGSSGLAAVSRMMERLAARDTVPSSTAASTFVEAPRTRAVNNTRNHAMNDASNPASHV